MSGYEQAALEPYLHIDSFMRREERSYSTKTTVYVRTAENADRTWASGLICVQFRTGVTAFKAELWECYKDDDGAGLGIKDLHERWVIGIAVFPNGASTKTISDVLGYVAESEAALAKHTEFLDRLHAFEAAFAKYIAANETKFPENTNNESAKFAVQAMIEAASD